MERWAANTLRTLGIIVTTIVVVCGCLLLFLESQCAAKGNFGRPDPNAAADYMFGAILLAIAGISFLAWLARGIVRSRRSSLPLPQDSDAVSVGATTAAMPTSAVPSDIVGLHSPHARRAVDRLFWCIAIQLAVSALNLLYSVVGYREMAPPFHALIPAIVISSVFYAAPYVVLLYLIRWRFNQVVLAFAISLPAAAILQAFVTTFPLIRLYQRSPTSWVQLALPLLLDIVIIVIAYQAARRTGLHPPVSSLLTAGTVAFVYFYVLHMITPILYRISRR